MTEKEISEKSQKFKDLLLGTNRKGIINVISELESLGFFQAPASTKYHGSYPGGLLDHSLNVYRQALYIFKIEQKIRPDVMKGVSEESILIASLLHDVCKADAYKSVERWRKNPNNGWESYVGYERVYPDDEFGHGEASVIRLLHWGLEMHKDEELAIRWHMGAWDLSTYNDARNCFDAATRKYPLASIISAADWLASRISEFEESEESK